MKHVSSDKKCYFAEKWIQHIDYKNIPLLLKFVNYFWKIKKSYYSWVARKKQAELAKSVKKARHMALISFVR